MIDAPERRSPRFPATAERRVAAAIEAALDDWDIGDGDVSITQGANGTDLMVAEAALRRGAASRVLLSSPLDEFIRSSVRPAGTAWEARFRAVLARSERVEVQPEPYDDTRFARSNARALDAAIAADHHPHVLVVTSFRDAREGGSDDFVTQARSRGLEVRTIDPTRAFRYEAQSSIVREDALDRPKRILSLDGGSMPGTRAVLTRIEELLGGGDDDYRLADTFDLVAGASTAAMTAAAIASGERIADVTGSDRVLDRAPAFRSLLVVAGAAGAGASRRATNASGDGQPGALAGAVESAVLDPPNDPSQSALDAVTSPRLGLAWSATRDDLLLVSIGTASPPAAADPRCRRVHYDAEGAPDERSQSLVRLAHFADFLP
jgi:hypothetical protein